MVKKYIKKGEFLHWRFRYRPSLKDSSAHLPVNRCLLRIGLLNSQRYPHKCRTKRKGATPGGLVHSNAAQKKEQFLLNSSLNCVLVQFGHSLAHIRSFKGRRLWPGPRAISSKAFAFPKSEFCVRVNCFANLHVSKMGAKRNDHF